MVMHTSDPSTQEIEAGRRLYLCEFETSQVYSEFQVSKDFKMRPCCNNNNMKQKQLGEEEMVYFIVYSFVFEAGSLSL